ncbi:hypothetical protein I7I48_10928 [Histoplasma ohiense]|nr:hypothetical protein I7I48_10928 [Histoplasma ohiense (nom. inval.)]
MKHRFFIKLFFQSVPLYAIICNRAVGITRCGRPTFLCASTLSPLTLVSDHLCLSFGMVGRATAILVNFALTKPTMRHWQDVILPPKVAVGCPQGMYISSFSSAHVLAPEDARISGVASNDRHALGRGIVRPSCQIQSRCILLRSEHERMEEYPLIYSALSALHLFTRM